MKSFGSSARRDVDEPAALEQHRGLVRARRVAPGRAGRGHQRRLTCRGVQPGCRWSSSAAAPATCGAAMLVPSKTANGAPANSGSVEERICPPGADTSGLSWWPNGVGPADEKLVIDAAAAGLRSRAGRWPRRGRRPPAVGGHAARRRAPSRSAIIPAGSASRIGIGVRLAGPVVDEDDARRRPPPAPARPSRRTCRSRARRARSRRSASRPEASLGGSFGSPDGPQRWRSTGLPSVPMIVPTSTSVWSVVAHARRRRGSSDCERARAGGRGRAGARDAVSAGAKTCEFETAATRIASGAVPGEPTLPRPKSSRSLPAEITGTTPAAATLSTRLDQRVVRGIGLGPPPEKLITSMPSATASSKAATISGVYALLPTGVGHVEDAVVPEPRARRDAGEVLHRGVVAGRPARRPRVAGGDPGDVRAVERGPAVERRAGPACPSPGRGTRARRSPSASCSPPALAGSRPDTEAGRVEERVRLVDPVVDDADLDALAARAGRRSRTSVAPISDGLSFERRACSAGSGRPCGRSRAGRACGSCRDRQLDREPSRIDPVAVATTFACGIARRSCAAARAWAAREPARYAREDALADVEPPARAARRRAPRP